MEPNTNSKIISLFPIPVLASNIGRPIKKHEYEFLNKNRSAKINKQNKISVDNNILADPTMREIKDFFLKGLNEYVDKIISPSTEVSPYITQSWLNWAENDQGHHLHNHPNSFLSGVFYINSNDDDTISFYRPVSTNNMLKFGVTQLNEYNYDKMNLNASLGTLYIFPSWMYHEVEARERDGVRISLAFNSFIKGETGERDFLTHLILP